MDCLVEYPHVYDTPLDSLYIYIYIYTLAEIWLSSRLSLSSFRNRSLSIPLNFA